MEKKSNKTNIYIRKSTLETKKRLYMTFMSRIGYISAYKGGIIVGVLVAVLAFVLPSGGSNEAMKLTLTISTFLFAIIAGFILSRQDTRYDKVREVLSHLDATWMSFYRAFRLFGANVQKKAAESIDYIYIRTYDCELWDYQETNIKFSLEKLYDMVKKLKPKTIAQKECVSDSLDKLTDLEVLEHETGEIAKERLMPGEWIILYILSGIIIFCVFYMRTFTLFSILFTILLATAIMIVMFIIRDLNNLRLKGELLAFESGQEVFDTIGKPRYYHANSLATGLVKPVGKTFRVGFQGPKEKMHILTFRVDEDWRTKVKRAYYQKIKPKLDVEKQEVKLAKKTKKKKS